MLKSLDRDISIISPHSADPRNNDEIQMFWNSSKSKQLDGKEGKSEWTEIKLDKIRWGLEVREVGKGYRFIGGEITNENRKWRWKERRRDAMMKGWMMKGWVMGWCRRVDLDDRAWIDLYSSLRWLLLSCKTGPFSLPAIRHTKKDHGSLFTSLTLT